MHLLRLICLALLALAGPAGVLLAIAQTAQDMPPQEPEPAPVTADRVDAASPTGPIYEPGTLPDAYPDKVRILRGDVDPHELFVEVPEDWATHSGMYAEVEALEAFGQMRAAAARDGIKLVIISAFRSFSHQRWIWEAKWRERYETGYFEAPRDLAAHIMRYSSMPGTSRHHWGTDFDINALNNRWFDTPEGRPVYDWMQANAAKYGFCEVYSERDGRRETGYEPERWHWSYIPTASRYLAAYVEARDAQPRGFEGDVAAPEINWLTDYVLGINPDCLWTAADIGNGRPLPPLLLRAAMEAKAAAEEEETCLGGDWTRDELLTWREGGFELSEEEDAARYLLGLERCLAEPDPALRDEIAFAGMSHILRAGHADEETLGQLKAELLDRMSPQAADPDGFSRPFAALALSEVARTDRISPWMSTGERRALVAAGAAYVSSVRDYRGFIEGEGWRHGLAHGADLLMQLSLNEETGEGEAIVMARAVFEALMVDEAPALVFEEPARLARPLIFLTQRGLLNEAQLSAWMDMLADPAPLESWEEAFGSEEALARRHNVRAFASALMLAAGEADDGSLDAVKPGATRLLATVP